MRSVSVRFLASSICASTVGASSISALTISAVSVGALLVLLVVGLLDWVAALLSVCTILWLLAVSEGLWLSLGDISSIGSSELAGWVFASISISTGLLLVAI